MNLIAAMLLVLPLVAAAGAPEVDIRLKRLPNKAYELQGSFTVSASSPIVWRVLTDYEGIPVFVSSMKSSRVRARLSDGSVLLEQQATGGMFVLTRTVTVLLDVRPEPQRLVFEDVGRESFWRYEGDWSTEASTAGTRVSYHLVAQPDFVAPSMIISRAMKNGAHDLLEQVRVEIMRRAGPAASDRRQ
jgi:carbon monoxide dehydrogenase subunit G